MDGRPPAPVSGYPVVVDVERQTTHRNRLTVGFRLILGAPHIAIVGGIATLGFGMGGLRDAGALAAAAFTMACIAWFAILFANVHPRGLWDFATYYMRWLVRVTAYLALLRDEYPPFGDDGYPTTFATEYPGEGRDRLSVFLRLLYVIPHGIVLAFVNLAWFVTSIVAWFSILFAGRYPDGLYGFGVGTLRWNVRVNSYLLLLRDEYPPFSLQP